MPIELKQVKLEEMSDVQYSFWTGQHPGKEYSRVVLAIRFGGTFGFGSGGNDDATFMCSMGIAAIKACEPEAVIIDLSVLKYQWGDQLGCVFGIGGEKPSALIVVPECREGIGTLCFGENSTTDACENEWIFDSFDAAWSYVTKRLDDGGSPPIHEAVEKGELKNVQRLLHEGEKPDRLDSMGRTPLHLASDIEIVKLLLHAGADVNAKDSCSLTPLHFVKDVECASLLLAAGADPDARSWTDLSPLGHVSSVEIAELLIKAGADVHLRRRTSLLHSIRNADIARVLIEAGANVNALDENGRTPLDVAEQSQQLFAKQADEYGFDSHRQQAMRYAELLTLFRKYDGQHGSSRKL